MDDDNDDDDDDDLVQLFTPVSAAGEHKMHYRQYDTESSSEHSTSV